MKTVESLATDGGRLPPLDTAALTSLLASGPGLWREVTVVTETGSTNADLLARARAGAPQGIVLVAEAQTAGRGRMGRRWTSPPRSALTFSVLLRPAGVPPGLLGWLPLLAGVAVAAAVAETAGVDARLKWPNDVLAGDDKLAGILAESWGEAVVVGAGINVCQRHDELPVPTATSLLLAAPAAMATAPGSPAPGSPASPAPVGPRGVAAAGVRERLLAAVLGELARWYRGWLEQACPGDADGCGLRAEYLRRCATVGRRVTVMLPGSRTLSGTAVGVDPAGRLEVRTGSGLVPVSAGDVIHLR